MSPADVPPKKGKEQSSSSERAHVEREIVRLATRLLGEALGDVDTVVHGLECSATPRCGAARKDPELRNLFAAIDKAPPALGAYKGFDRLEVALARYRQRYR